MIPIFKPYMPNDVIGDITSNLYSGKLSYGEKGKLFEETVGNYIGNKNFLSTSSYNHAMLIAISTLDLKSGDEIIASPMSCLASNQPFAIKGLNVNWVDIDPNTGSICIDDLKKKLSNKTKAVFVNHYCGYLADQKVIYELVKQFNIPIVDDAIESFGSQYYDKLIGNHYADITVFSFQTVRLPNTIEGGGLAFSNESLYEKAFKIRDYGIDRKKFRNELNEISLSCDIELEGYGALLAEFNSIIGIKQMNDLNGLLTKQRNNAHVWKNVIENIPQIKSLEVIENTKPNYWIYGIRVLNKRETLLRFRERGMYATGVHINNNIYSVFNDKKELKGVNEFKDTFVAIPCGWWVSEEEIEQFLW